MTVLEVIQRSADYLARKGVESPRLQVELLLARVLHMPRLQLYLNFERVLAEPELSVMRELVRRRGGREPLQHLVGTVSFCGYELTVNRHVLIPRPETELLAEHAWRHLNAMPVSEPTVFDFGTGSGCLAIAVAAKCPAARVWAVDNSAAALDVARANASKNQVAERIEWLCGDGFAPLPSGLRFDLMVANPPYIPTAEIDRLQPEVRYYDPRNALDGGPDGLVFTRRLAVESVPWLKPSATLMLECGDGQSEVARCLFAAAGWEVAPAISDLTGQPRILVARRPVR